LTVSNTLTAQSNLALNATLADADDEVGTLGQILASTTTGTNWIDSYAPDSGSVTHTTLRWNGSAWVQNASLLSDDSTTATVTTDLTVGGNTSLNGTLTVSNTLTAQSNLALNATLADADDDVGTLGQVLTSTSTGTAWLNANAIPVSLRTVSADTSIVSSDGTVVVRATSTATITITLPLANTVPEGSYFIVKRLDNSATPTAVNIVAGNATDTIDGNTNAAYTTQLANNAAKMTLQSDGNAAWYIVSQ
jgi:hypothetical protein